MNYTTNMKWDNSLMMKNVRNQRRKISWGKRERWEYGMLKLKNNVELLSKEQLQLLRAGKSPWPNTTAPKRPNKNLPPKKEKKVSFA